MSTNEDIWRDYAEHQDDAETLQEMISGVVETLEYDDYAEGYTEEEVDSFKAWTQANKAMLQERFSYWDDDDDEGLYDEEGYDEEGYLIETHDFEPLDD